MYVVGDQYKSNRHIQLSERAKHSGGLRWYWWGFEVLGGWDNVEVHLDHWVIGFFP